MWPGGEAKQENPISCCYTTVEGRQGRLLSIISTCSRLPRPGSCWMGPAGRPLASLGKRCSELGWQQGVWVAVGRDVSEQSGKAGLVGHGGRLRGAALISRERIGILLPARAEEPASSLKYCSIP